MKILLPILVALHGLRRSGACRVGRERRSGQSVAQGGGRKLSVGAGVEARERITTDANGSAQIVFRDNSTMTVGHGSSITINKFVYNGKRASASSPRR